MVFILIVFSLFLFLIGLAYFYHPSLIIKLNKWVRDMIFNDARVLIDRKKMGIICIVLSVLIFYTGVFIPRFSSYFKQQDIRDDLYRAWCYYYQGNYDQAEKLCREVMFISPDNLTAKEQLGLIYFVKGDYKKSMYYCREVLRGNPNNKRIEKIVSLLESKGFKK